MTSGTQRLDRLGKLCDDTSTDRAFRFDNTERRFNTEYNILYDIFLRIVLCCRRSVLAA